MVTTVLIALFSRYKETALASASRSIFRGNTPNACSRCLSNRIAFTRARSLRIRQGVASQKLDPTIHVGANDPTDNQSQPAPRNALTNSARRLQCPSPYPSVVPCQGLCARN
jgi:hypothetical protein